MTKLQKTQVLNGYGFPFFDKYKSICETQIHNFGTNLYTVKTLNGYTFEDLNQILGISKSSLRRFIKYRDKPHFFEWLRINPAYFSLLAEWKKYAESHIPP